MNSNRIEFDVNAVLSRHVDREALDRYYVELMKENAVVNLVSRETSRSNFDRLSAESLLPLDVMPKQITNYLDIGAGGGIPAIPLILSGRISGQTILVERTLKKAAALGRIKGSLKIQCQVIARTFEELSLSDRFDLITLRLVRLDLSLLRKIAPQLSEDGRLVYYSTKEIPFKGLKTDSYSFTDSEQGFIKYFTVFRTK